MSCSLIPIAPARAAEIDCQADAIRDFALLGAALRSPRRYGARDIEIDGKRFVYDAASGRLYELPCRGIR